MPFPYKFKYLSTSKVKLGKKLKATTREKMNSTSKVEFI
jgi:hypothetical protein